MGSRTIHRKNYRISLQPGFTGFYSVECIRVSRMFHSSGDGCRFLHDAYETGLSAAPEYLSPQFRLPSLPAITFQAYPLPPH